MTAYEGWNKQRCDLCPDKTLATHAGWTRDEHKLFMCEADATKAVLDRILRDVKELHAYTAWKKKNPVDKAPPESLAAGMF